MTYLGPLSHMLRDKMTVSRDQLQGPKAGAPYANSPRAHHPTCQLHSGVSLLPAKVLSTRR